MNDRSLGRLKDLPVRFSKHSGSAQAELLFKLSVHEQITSGRVLDENEGGTVVQHPFEKHLNVQQCAAFVSHTPENKGGAAKQENHKALPGEA
jgi:hypothetical protein